MDSSARAALIVIACGSLGIMFAAIEQVLYAEGVLIDEIVSSTATLPDIMAVTIIIWLIIGVALAVAQR